MSRRRVPGWPGYIHQQKNGLDLFIIERKIRGERYHVSTGAHSMTAALAQLARFEADPANYRPDGGGTGAPLLLTNKLIEEWEAYSIEKENGRVYTRDHGRKLATWMLKLGGTDLRQVTLRQLLEGLQGLSAQKHRIIAIKAFYGWLRTKKALITTAQDATLDLQVPKPKKRRERKSVKPWDDVAAVLAQLTQEAEADRWRPRGAHDKLEPGEDALRRRDCLLLLTATGWHITELVRFIRGGELLRQASGDVLAVLVVLHKGGELTRTPLTHREHVEAAERLRASGVVPRNLQKEHNLACARAEVPAFGLGKMRHSVATWAFEDGADPAKISTFLGHKDPRTTKRFYIDLAVPTNVVPLRRVKG